VATIICGIDDSPGAAEALRVARDVSANLDARLVVAHAAAGYKVAGADEGVSGLQAKRGAARLLERVAREQGIIAQTDQRIETGEPAEVLARIAAEERATMIVVGSRRQGLRRRKLLSGIAEELAETAPCPVVIVPPATRR
jgi:nucleotide-binding universal stress UspA family protein